MSGRVFVQDTGTGLQDDNEQDWLDAANLMALSHSPNDSGYVVEGLGITPDFANDEVSVSSGQCKVTATDVQTTDHSQDSPRSVDQYTWPEVTATVLVDSDTVTISSTGETDIWVDSGLDSSTPDDVSLVTSEPSGPSIHIGTVDADAETVDELNRSPDAQFDDLSATSGEFDAVSAGELLTDGDSWTQWQEIYTLDSEINTDPDIDIDVDIPSKYDFVRLQYQAITGTSANLGVLELQVNGDVGGNYNYREITTDDDIVSELGESSIPLAYFNNNQFTIGELLWSRGSNADRPIAVSVSATHPAETDRLFEASNASTGTLSSIQIFTDGVGSDDAFIGRLLIEGVVL